VKKYPKPGHCAGLVQISPGQFSPGPEKVGIGPILVQKLLGLDWTGLGRTRSGLVQCWTDGIIAGSSVIKCGRTTATTYGKVNCIYLQRWISGAETTEIAVVGLAESGVFANRGDSGSALLLEQEGSLWAAGMVMGKNRQNEFVIVTPLQAIIRDLKETTGVQYSWDGFF